MKPLWQQRLHLGARALGWVAGIAVIALAVLLALAVMAALFALNERGQYIRIGTASDPARSTAEISVDLADSYRYHSQNPRGTP